MAWPLPQPHVLPTCAPKFSLFCWVQHTLPISLLSFGHTTHSEILSVPMDTSYISKFSLVQCVHHTHEFSLFHWVYHTPKCSLFYWSNHIFSNVLCLIGHIIHSQILPGPLGASYTPMFSLSHLTHPTLLNFLSQGHIIHSHILSVPLDASYTPKFSVPWAYHIH